MTQTKGIPARLNRIGMLVLVCNPTDREQRDAIVIEDGAKIARSMRRPYRNPEDWYCRQYMEQHPASCRVAVGRFLELRWEMHEEARRFLAALTPPGFQEDSDDEDDDAEWIPIPRQPSSISELGGELKGLTVSALQCRPLYKGPRTDLIVQTPAVKQDQEPDEDDEDEVNEPTKEPLMEAPAKMKATTIQDPNAWSCIVFNPSELIARVTNGKHYVIIGDLVRQIIKAYVDVMEQHKDWPRSDQIPVFTQLIRSAFAGARGNELVYHYELITDSRTNGHRELSGQITPNVWVRVTVERDCAPLEIFLGHETWLKDMLEARKPKGSQTLTGYELPTK